MSKLGGPIEKTSFEKIDDRLNELNTVIHSLETMKQSLSLVKSAMIYSRTKGDGIDLSQGLMNTAKEQYCKAISLVRISYDEQEELKCPEEISITAVPWSTFRKMYEQNKNN